MATLLSLSHLFNLLHVHPCGVRRRRWQWQLVLCTGDPSGQEHPNSLWPEGCCAASSCSPSAGDWCGSCWNGTGQVTPAAHHKQGFDQAVTIRLLHGVNNTNCFVLVSLTMLCPYIPGFALSLSVVPQELEIWT